MTPFLTLPEAQCAEDCDRVIALAQAGAMKDAGLVRQTTEHRIRRAEIGWLDDLAGGDWVMDRRIGWLPAPTARAWGST